MTPEFTSIARASRLTGVSQRTIRAAYDAKRVRGIHDGRRFKVAVDDVRALADYKRIEAHRALTRRERLQELGRKLELVV